MTNFEQEPGRNDPTAALPVPTEQQLDLAMVFDCSVEELENLAAYFDHADAEITKIAADPGLVGWTADEYCWDDAHQGGWSCRDCYKEQLLTLVRDYYTAAKIGAAMEDQTFDDEQNYESRMQDLMQRTEKLLSLEQEAEKACLLATSDYKETHREEYHEFLDATVDDAHYNAYLEHIHTPRPEDY